ncbi:MAG: OsmC family protein, partial [Paracoccaceae bacterium]|nr:OsmC family protein [Paracoccaceae bacterium]
DGAAIVTLAGRQFEIRRQFIEDIGAASLDASLGKLGCALLVLHAPRDSMVGIDNAAHIFAAARHPKSFVTLDDADHLLSRDEDAEYAAEVITAWSRRYLTLAPEPMRPAAPEGVVRVAEAGTGAFRQDVMVGGKHQLVIDEPETMGGGDLGPSPYQLLSAALGACTSITLRLYAKRKAMPLAQVTVEVTHNKCHSEDCVDCDTSAPTIDRFHRHIRLEGDLTDEQRHALLAIADKCPVHRTLHGQAIIETDLTWLTPQGAL